MKLKKILAASAALLAMTFAPVNVFADTLAERDGLKYLISDSGEDLGLYSGWTKKGDDHYYYKDGVRKKNCWLTSNGEKKYFLQADGTRATGKVTVNGVEYEFDSNGVILPDAWGLTLTAKDVTSTGCTLVFTQSGGTPTGKLQSGSYFIMECYTNGEWKEVEQLPQEYAVPWTMESWGIINNDSTEYPGKWSFRYGELPAGKYRIGKNVMDFRKPADYDTKMYYAYFEVRTELAPLTNEAESKLKEDFASYRSELRGDNIKSEEAFVRSYYGTYNGCEAVVMWIKDHAHTEDMKYITVGGYTFELGSGSFDILLHKDSGFVDLKTAYDKGYLCDKDIAEMYYYQKNYPIYKIDG